MLDHPFKHQWKGLKLETTCLGDKCLLTTKGIVISKLKGSIITSSVSDFREIPQPITLGRESYSIPSSSFQWISNEFPLKFYEMCFVISMKAFNLILSFPDLRFFLSESCVSVWPEGHVDSLSHRIYELICSVTHTECLWEKHALTIT